MHIIQLSRPLRPQSMQCGSHHYHTRWVCDSQKSVVCAIGIVMAGTGFRSRSTNMKPQKAGFPKLTRCHGSTSPSLANMRPNSGHRVRSQRQGAKKESKWPSWQKNQNRIMKLPTKSMPAADIAQLIGRKEETVRKRTHRNEKTNEME